MAAIPPVCDFGWQAPDFSLPATDGRRYALSDIRGEHGTVVMFICNHCPYVTGAIDRIVRDMTDLQGLGIGVAAICSNDARAYPADGFERMGGFARAHGFTFPYLHDESQAVARAYDAVCTPDFFGFDAGMGLQYRGRLDPSRRPATGPVPRELFAAMAGVAEGRPGPAEQTPSMGCSIKWRR